MQIAMVGTRGVPARYGGFETCVEEVGARLAARGHDVTVYCRNAAESTDGRSYRGMRLVRLPALRRRSLETISHSFLSVAHLVGHRRPDAVLLFNAANAPLLPLLRARHLPVATHVDGLEWKRAKWGRAGRRYYRAAETLAVRWSDELIADARGIEDYYRTEFAATTRLIAYGAKQLAPNDTGRLAELQLAPHGYHLVVARFEPENNVDVLVDGYRRSAARLPLVVVGSAPYADEYTSRIRALADARVRLLGAVWDQDLLDQLYAGALTYLHGHSVGGTNPSLLRAVGAQTATLAYDVGFNREVLGESGEYFRHAPEVSEALEKAESDPDSTILRGLATGRRAALYDWDDVADRYEELCRRLATEGPRAHRPSGRRRGPAVRAPLRQPVGTR